MGGKPSLSSIHVSGCNIIGSSNTMSTYVVSSAECMDDALVFLSNKMDGVGKAANIPLQAASHLLANSLESVSEIGAQAVQKASTIAGTLLSDGLKVSTNDVSNSMLQATSETAESIFDGFNDVAMQIVDSSTILDQAVNNNSIYFTEVLKNLTKQNTDEFLITIICLTFIFVPFFLYVAMMVKIPKARARATLVYLSSFGLIACFLCALGQLVRYAIYELFTISNIIMCMFMAVYSFIFFCYLLFVFFAERRLIWKVTKREVLRFFRIVKTVLCCLVCGCRCCYNKDRRKYVEVFTPEGVDDKTEEGVEEMKEEGPVEEKEVEPGSETHEEEI